MSEIEDYHGDDSRRRQPPWQPPIGGVDVGLKLYNSLTRKKEPFVPLKGRDVLWYSCGPTVYDSSHMGHARAYISLDILRRVLKDYFNYNVTYAMNITDIDDKIILRARQKYLYEKYVSSGVSLNQALLDVQEAIKQLEVKIAKEQDEDKKKMYERTMASVTQAVADSERALPRQDTDIEQTKNTLLQTAKDIMCSWLDSKHGTEVTDNDIFAKLPQYFEQEFHEDMAALNVLPADVLTRVSEYVPEVIDFVEKIIVNGYGYVSADSVYFDTVKYSQDESHFYAKLVPEAFGDQKALHEGEGDLSISQAQLSEKKSPNDFALWKASKPGEPSWESPWGKGRPGWHIECSVMASSILGERMDIHTGGVDLKFPHHDNELAQAEACYGHNNWVQYFLHSGHLKIEGCKMSKSLKNFVTIRSALETHTARQLRLVFLLHAWKDTLDYSTETMAAALNYEKLVGEFFLMVKDILRKTASVGTEAFTKWQLEELALNQKFLACKTAVHEALCDSVDTRSTLDAMRDLVGQVNVYVAERRKAGTPPNRQLLKNIAEYITKMLKIFGAIEGDDPIGFPTAGSSGAANVEDIAMPYLDAFAKFRESVRVVARKQAVGEILNLCDDVRDNILPNLGVRLEDHEGQESVIKFVDKETLLKEREEKLKQEQAKQQEREQKKAEAAGKQAKLDAQRSIPPEKLFVEETDKYSQFDDRGIPTHDNKGEEISKSQRKKLVKLYEAQEKKYKDYIASQNNQ